MSNLMVMNTMTSKEVAELTGKRHDNIMADIKDEIKKLSNSGEVTELKFQVSEYIDPTGRKLPMYQLSIEGVLQLGARYDAVTRSKLIAMALQPKQQEPKFKIPQTYAEALIEAGRLATELEVKEKQLEEQKPKVEFVDKLMKSKDNILVRDYAKILNGEGLNIGEKRLYKWLRDNEYLMKDNAFYQKYSKYFVMRENAIDTMFGVKITKTTLITPEGQVFLYSKLKEVF